MQSVVLGIHLLESCVNYELFHNAQSYPPLLALLQRAKFTIHLSVHFFHISLIPFLSSDYDLTPNLYKTASNYNMRLFCCSV